MWGLDGEFESNPTKIISCPQVLASIIFPWHTTCWRGSLALFILEWRVESLFSIYGIISVVQLYPVGHKFLDLLASWPAT